MHEPETVQDNRRRAKLALAIGLAVVFVAVVTVQIGKCWPDADVTGNASPNRSASDPLDADPSQLPKFNRTVEAGKKPNGQWPEVRLAECTAYDPFATPDGFILKKKTSVQQEPNGEALKAEIEIARKRAAQEQVISSLREAGVNAVFKGPERNTAVVGTQMVRVGEEVKGFRVLAIEPDGIVIERPNVE